MYFNDKMSNEIFVRFFVNKQNFSAFLFMTLPHFMITRERDQVTISIAMQGYPNCGSC